MPCQEAPSAGLLDLYDGVSPRELALPEELAGRARRRRENLFTAHDGPDIAAHVDLLGNPAMILEGDDVLVEAAEKLLVLEHLIRVRVDVKAGMSQFAHTGGIGGENHLALLVVNVEQCLPGGFCGFGRDTQCGHSEWVESDSGCERLTICTSGVVTPPIIAKRTGIRIISGVRTIA